MFDKIIDEKGKGDQRNRKTGNRKKVNQWECVGWSMIFFDENRMTDYKMRKERVIEEIERLKDDELCSMKDCYVQL